MIVRKYEYFHEVAKALVRLSAVLRGKQGRRGLAGHGSVDWLMESFNSATGPADQSKPSPAT